MTGIIDAETQTTPAQCVSAEELSQLGETEYLHELIDGELVAMPRPKYRHGRITGKLAALVGNYVYTRNLGDIVIESGFLLSYNPDIVRGPDLAFVASGRILSESEQDTYFAGAPDLVVEIVSPTDKAIDVRTMVQQYLTSGAHLLWLIYPALRLVDVYRVDGSVTILHDEDLLDGEAVLPGFQMAVSTLFE